jgi:hypothetical protein
VIPKQTDEDFLDSHEDFNDNIDQELELGLEDEYDRLNNGISDDDYDEDELERRRSAYADLKKTDKIFNNTYNLGLEFTEEDDDNANSSRGGSEIKLDSGSADYHLTDPGRYADHVDLVIVRKDINSFIQGNSEVLAILGDEPEKKKFTKPEMNLLFNLILSGLSKGSSINVFISPIHVLDSISSTVNMEYKKIFDMLTYENKELLLIELNSKYGFLDSLGKNYKMF